MLSKNRSASQGSGQSDGRKGAKASAPTIISGHTKMIGTMSTPADVQLEGEFEGDIQAHHAIVGEHATLTGHLGAEEVTIRGVVDGIVKARLVRLAGTARVDGDVYHASLEVEAGATLTGRCVRSDDPRNVKENGQKSMGAQSRPQLTSGERNTKRDDKNDAA